MRNILLLLVVFGLLGAACRSEEPKSTQPPAAPEVPANSPATPAAEVSPTPVEPAARPTPEPTVKEGPDSKQRLVETYSALFCATAADESADLVAILGQHGYGRLSEWSAEWDAEARADPDWARSVAERVTPGACR